MRLMCSLIFVRPRPTYFGLKRLGMQKLFEQTNPHYKLSSNMSSVCHIENEDVAFMRYHYVACCYMVETSLNRYREYDATLRKQCNLKHPGGPFVVNTPKLTQTDLGWSTSLFVELLGRVKILTLFIVAYKSIKKGAVPTLILK